MMLQSQVTLVDVPFLLLVSPGNLGLIMNDDIA